MPGPHRAISGRRHHAVFCHAEDMVADPIGLGQFLQARRRTREPKDAGLPGGGRRRVSGLRREETATLAGVSIDYLIRLEQGRHREPSAEVLSALASALGLGLDERSHLFALAGRHDPYPQRILQRVASPAAARLVERAQPSPAWLLNRVKDILLWNTAAALLLGDPALLPEAERNYVRLTFASRDMWIDDDLVCSDTVAHLRQTALPLEAEAARPLIDKLIQELPEFATLWDRHDVRRSCGSFRAIHHPDFGPLTFTTEIVDIDEGDMHVVIYEPKDDRTRQWSKALPVAGCSRETPS
jgi:transcriptional regulator with XRE-family HTH domain